MKEPGHLRLSRAAAAARAPVLFRQARRLRREIPRLPDAARPWQGALDGPHPIRLLVLGDSTAAGVGVADQREGLPGRLADALHRRTGRGVAWRAVGENGATARDLLIRFLREATADGFDLAFVSVGANDALGLRSAAAFARDLRRVLQTLSAAQPGALVIVSSLPVFGRFAVLPEPLRTALFRHSLNLERAGRAVVARDPRWAMPAHPPPYADDFFAGDGFHPGPTGYRDWAEWAIDDTWPQAAARLTPVD